MTTAPPAGPGGGCNRWAWFGSADGQGGFAGINIATNGTGAWAANTAFNSLDLQVDGDDPWSRHARDINHVFA